ncbi:MAG: hypothetical protein AB1634_15060 [Thermodesulfobacteriota bacterium]
MCDIKTEAAAHKKGGSVPCPNCGGQKTVPGFCTCNMEWRGTQVGDQWEDCKCAPDVECPTCHGAGTVPA